MSNEWSARVSDDVAFRRAGGRLHYNSIRQETAYSRQTEIINAWDWSTLMGFGGGDLTAWGGQARLARKLGVSPATISRDLKKIRGEYERSRCPTCDGSVRLEHWRNLEQQGRVKLKKPKKRRRKTEPDLGISDEGDLSEGGSSSVWHGGAGRLPASHWDEPSGHQRAGLDLDGPEVGVETAEPEQPDDRPIKGHWHFAPGAFDV